MQRRFSDKEIKQRKPRGSKYWQVTHTGDVMEIKLLDDSRAREFAEWLPKYVEWMRQNRKEEIEKE